MRKNSIKWLSIACMLLLSLGFMLWGAACGDRPYVLYGFEPTAEISALQGDFVRVETMHVFDSEDNYYDVKYKVTDENDRQVEMSGKGFFVANAADYKIIYTVIGVQGVYIKQTLVKVKPKDDGQRLNIYVPEIGFVKEPLEIVVDNALMQKYSFVVTVARGEDVKTLENRIFVPEQAGRYTVTVQAISDAEMVTQIYTVEIKPEMTEGTIEAFDESWSDKRGNWSVATTGKTGLRDRFGGNGSFLTLETDAEYLNVFVSPKRDKEYYRMLAEEGYEYVSVWVYLDGRLAHTVQQYKGSGAFYYTTHKVLPKTWCELRYNLQDDPKYDYEGSFLKGFNAFAAQTQPIFLVDNSDAYNYANGGRERDEKGNIVPYKIYLDDIYAVKAGEAIKIDETVKPTIKTGETYDLKALIDSPAKNELIYTVTYRGQTTVAENGNYTFTADGVYEFTASYGAGHPNKYGSTTGSLEIRSPYTVEIGTLIKEKTGSSVEVDLKELDARLKDENGNRLRNVSVNYSVFRNGTKLSAPDGNIILSSVGCYEVEAEMGYKVGDLACKAYARTDLDVWDEADKYTVFGFDGNSEYFADSYYMNKGWDIVPEPKIVGEANGRQGSFAKMEITDQQQPVFAVKPLYSLNYYKWLWENDSSLEKLGELFVTFDYMVDDRTQGGAATRRVAAFPSKTQQIVNCGTWYSVRFTLEEFINGYYAQMSDGFGYLKELRGGENITVDNTQGYAFFYLANPYQYATDVYMGGCLIECDSYTGKFLDISDSAHIYAWDYNWQKLGYSEVFTVEEDKTVGGETGTMLCYDGTQQSFGFQYLPVHTKAYYEYILRRYPSAYVSVKLYVRIEGKEEGIAWIGVLGKEQTRMKLGEWVTVRIPLSDIVRYFDALTISSTGDPARKNLISVNNGYYAVNGEYNRLNVFFRGFDFVLGNKDPDIDGIPKKEENVGNDIFE